MTGRPVQTRFRYGSTSFGLALPLKITRRLIMQKARGQAFSRSKLLEHSPSTGYRQMVSGSISLPSLGFFSPFPHGTGSLSVGNEYLALEDGPPIFRQDNTCPVLLIAHLVPQTTFHIQGYHLLWPNFPDRFTKSFAKECWLFPFRSPLLRESRLISIPPGT